MSSGNLAPTYVEACTRRSSASLRSDWLSPSDFGECFVRPSDSQQYPCVVPVYNGQILDIKPDFLHASLSGISIKHYYGMCTNEADIKKDKAKEEEEREDDVYEDETWAEDNQCEGNFYGPVLFGLETKQYSWIGSGKAFVDGKAEATVEDAVEEFEDRKEFLPECARQKINNRNSFWDLHKPELCKLTWPQKYVSSVTVTEHLHEHLLSHGEACAKFHDEKDMVNMLHRELDEYGRLKVLALPREIPPDEKPFEFKGTTRLSGNKGRTQVTVSKCKGFARFKAPSEVDSRCLRLSDDDDGLSGKILRRSKEEFCLTIGRHIRKPSLKETISEMDNVYDDREGNQYAGEEECGFFFFDWLAFAREECYEEGATADDSTVDLEPVATVPLSEPCPVIGMTDFCRAVAKADFSDLRCHPDDF